MWGIGITQYWPTKMHEHIELEDMKHRIRITLTSKQELGSILISY